MKKNVEVSIIVPVYNTASYLPSCLESLTSQTYSNIEILLINDGSTDSSETIIKSFQEKDSRIRYFHQENRGVSAARNLGIEKAKGKYLCFVDSDDVVSNTFVEDFLTYFLEDTDLVATSIISLHEMKKKKKEEKFIIKEYGKEKRYDIIYDEFSGFLCNKMFRTSIIRKSELSLSENISMCEDMLFLYQYLIYCRKVVGFTKINYYYRLSHNTASNNFQNEKWFSNFEALKGIYSLREYYPETILKRVVYIIHKNYVEGQYRLSYLEESKKKEKEKELESVKQFLKEIPIKMDLRDNIKILIFQIFKNTSMKYLKRKVR